MIKRKHKLSLVRVYLCYCLLIFISRLANAEPLFDSQLNVMANHHNDKDTWLAGELGRYDLSSNKLLVEFQLAYQYKINQNLSFNSHIQAQKASESISSNTLGAVELNLRYTKDIDWHQNLSFTLGQFFLPISMENSEQFWESTYTIHFSSLNSWIGEEFRPIGLDSQYRYFLDNEQSISLAASLFGGNDSMGALLAYRGWSIGRQRSALGDMLSLPELEIFADGNAFAEQRDDGTRPFGKDLDNRPGYALRTQFSSDQLLLSFAWIDNRGDRELHHGEYAWDTRFSVLGASWLITNNWEILAEASQGRSTMGAGPGVDIEFYSAYVMASYLQNHKRLSLRLEQFGNEDKDLVDKENHDLGRALTLGLFWQPENTQYKLGFDVIYLNSKRVRSTLKGSHEDAESINLSIMGNIKF